MKKKLAIAALALLTVSTVSGCNPTEIKSGDSGYEFTYIHSDGTHMDCIRMGHGLTCDWSNNP